MAEFIRRTVRFLFLTVLTLAGLAMAIVFTVSTLIALAIAMLVASLRGQRISPREYWNARQSRRKPLFRPGSLRSGDVTDVQSRDVT